MENKPFIEGAYVIIVDEKGKKQDEGVVLSYDDEIDMYTILISKNHIESFKSNKVKGWWSK